MRFDHSMVICTEGMTVCVYVGGCIYTCTSACVGAGMCSAPQPIDTV